ncbi:GNAT family N-acetyltransferase [Paraburkholderia sp. C35]|uniref:GNAT family N-acetyltransferase n=1 Tax=Paraburkholderia sp. C35 TaxID=2126993 RepID=UPI001EF704C6|nr:GNAT family N-acetyltransferase [Paraburkholderia sp. C35]
MLLAETGSLVESQGENIAVRTPDAPEYFFGNMLVLPWRPSTRDLKRLEYDFAQLVGEPPLIAHRTFAWSESAESTVNLDAFVKQGYIPAVCRVLAAHPDDIRPIEKNSLIKVRPFDTAEDWDAWSRMHLSDMSDPTDSSQRYIEYQRKAYTSLINRDLGNWWGAYIEDEQVGSLGLFFLGGIARFQSVITAPQHRNTGICKTLVSEVIRQIAGRSNRLIIVADEAYHAGNIYMAMGFQQQGRIASLCQEPLYATTR